MGLSPVIRYAFVALLLLASSSSNAADVWRSYWSEYVASGASVEATCFYYNEKATEILGFPTYYTTNGSSCSVYRSGSGQFKGSSAPVYLSHLGCEVIGDGSYTDNGSGTCEQAPVYSCSSGKVAVVEVTRPDGGLFPSSICIPQTEGEDNLCAYDSGIVPITQNNTMALTYTTAPAGETSNSCDTLSPEAGTVLRLPFSPDSLTGQLTDQDTRFTSQDDTFLPPESVCVANGDGSNTCVTISSTTSTYINGQGTVTSSDGTSVTTTNSAGTTTTNTQTSTSTDDGNNTVEDIVTTTTSSHFGSSSTTSTNGNDGSSSTITTPASTPLQSSSTTTTTTYPDGSIVTTSTTDTFQPETPVSGDASVAGSCGAPNQPACEISISGFDAFSPSTALSESGINEQLDGVIEIIEAIGDDDISTSVIDIIPFSLPTLGVCNPSAFDITYHGQSANLMTKFCTVYESQLHPIFRFFVYALTLFGLYRVYLQTIVRMT